MAERGGVYYQTDYQPIDRLALVLKEIKATGLPSKTVSITYPDFAYVKEQGCPFTVINGDFSVVQAHIVRRHEITPQQIVSLAAPQ